jgi:hypothetical protein
VPSALPKAEPEAATEVSRDVRASSVAEGNLGGDTGVGDVIAVDDGGEGAVLPSSRPGAWTVVRER